MVNYAIVLNVISGSNAVLFKYGFDFKLHVTDSDTLACHNPEKKR